MPIYLRLASRLRRCNVPDFNTERNYIPMNENFLSVFTVASRAQRNMSRSIVIIKFKELIY